MPAYDLTTEINQTIIMLANQGLSTRKIAAHPAVPVKRTTVQGVLAQHRAAQEEAPEATPEPEPVQAETPAEPAPAKASKPRKSRAPKVPAEPTEARLRKGGRLDNFAPAGSELRRDKDNSRTGARMLVLDLAGKPQIGVEWPREMLPADLPEGTRWLALCATHGAHHVAPTYAKAVEATGKERPTRWCTGCAEALAQRSEAKAA